MFTLTSAADVRYCVHIGQDMLTLSSSELDPFETSLRSGASWANVSGRYGSPATIYNRFSPRRAPRLFLRRCIDMRAAQR
jgi:hypothetical protein